MSATFFQKESASYLTMPEVMIYLDVFIENQGRELKMTMEEKKPGEGATLQQYFRTDICPGTLQSLSREVYSLLNRSTHSSGYNSQKIGKSLQNVGRHLYDSLFPIPVKEKLTAAGSRNLLVTMDDALVGIPWEILHDGEEFFCLRFNMGRKVHTSHTVLNSGIRNNEAKIKMWILADPTNDLPNSYNEGDTLGRKLEKWGDDLEVFLETTYIDSKKIFRRIFEFDIIHYAGHAVFNHENPNLSGWHLKDGYLTAQQIMHMSGGKKKLPSLIFSNACQSGHTSEWSQMEPDRWSNYQAFDMVNAFLRCGVRHYIGTFQDIPDPASFNLALNFYNCMMQSNSVGESLRRARLQAIDQYGQDSLIWANYMLYGDPTICYLKCTGKRENHDATNLSKSKVNDDIESEGYENQERVTDRDKLVRAGDGSNGKKSLQSSIKEPKERIEKEVVPAAGKKWQRQMLLWIGCVILLVFIIGAVYLFFTPPFSPRLSSNAFDSSWKKEKWQIVGQIQEKLSQRYSVQGHSDQGSLKSVYPDSSKNDHLTMCIIPAVPQGREQGIDQQMTAYLIEELNLFWINQPGFVLVERDRLDFVLEELERATSNLSERKIQFTLGKVLGAKGILFVRIYPHAGRFSLPFFSQAAKIFIRFVDTETTAIEAYAKASLKRKENLEEMSRNLGESILHSLTARYKL